jgi:hypothetical protein
MRGNIITLGNKKLSFSQFCEKIENYELELTRGDLVGVLRESKAKNPSLIPAILNVVKSTYHINMKF